MENADQWPECEDHGGYGIDGGGESFGRYGFWCVHQRNDQTNFESLYVVSGVVVA